ncbi:MAG: peptidylprolyl isomerase [Acidobacteriia bacterium]|nr:peptidylprolyl isomerase [Terriglobia bacterium]
MVVFLALGAAPLFGQQQPAPTGAPPKLDPGLYATIHTSMGTITAELFEKQAPITVRNFIALARGTRQWLDPKTRMPVTRQLYENLIFHRVIPGFMVQTGDPTGTGAYSCGFTLPDEISALRFDQPGRLAMANKGPNTGDCQFFITDAATPWLNGLHTIFGQVVDGQKVVGKITNVIRDDKDRPRFPIKLINVEVVRVVPAAEHGAPTATGSGLFINSEGDVLATYESVQGCSQLAMKDGSKLQPAFVDRQNNLALLRSQKKPDAVARLDEGETQVGGARLKSAMVTGFLEANGVRFETGGTKEAAESPGIVEIQCWK